MKPLGAPPVAPRWWALPIGLHGLIHFVGAAEGLGWPAAGIALLAVAGLVATRRSAWWMLALPAAVLSQAMIVTAWSEAWAGTLVNAALVVLALHALAATGPWSLFADWRREVGPRCARRAGGAPVREADAAHLPEPVRRYLAVAGAIGRPRPTHVRAVWRGRIRASAAAPWMPFDAEQHNFLDEPARFFWMRAHRGGVPVDVLHAFSDGQATMRARALSLFTVVDARGPEPTRAETVTLLNDVCLLAPGALVSPTLRWDPLDARSARVHLVVGANAVSAVLHFDDAGDLVDFVSDDRLLASPDGSSFTPQRWSTPIAGYQELGGVRVMRHGEGRWHPPGAPDFSYIEMDLLHLDVAPPPVERTRATP